MNFKKTLLFTSILICTTTIADTYKVNINDKHYINSIQISDFVDNNTNESEFNENADKTSCKTILDTNGSTGDGIYTLDSGYDVFCDMTTSGGGWMLILTEGAGASQWSQFSGTHSGTPLENGYRGSSNLRSIPFTDILWYNHPNNEYTAFTQRTGSSLTLNGIPTTENATYIYKANDGQQRTQNSYYNLISAPSFTGSPSPILMMSGSDEYGDEQGGATYGKAYNNWEGDLTSWYYRYAGTVGGSYSGNPWKENGHTALSEKVQSFFIR